MAAWMEDDDASELHDYLRGFRSSKRIDVNWNMIMEGESALVDDRSRGREMHQEKGGGKFIKGKASKCKEKSRYDLVSSTVVHTNKFLKNSHVSPSASDYSFQVSSASSLLSDDQPSEMEKQPHARVTSSAHTSLHSDASGFESAEDTRSSVASEHASLRPQQKGSVGSRSTSPTVTVALPHVQFAADLTLSPASATPDLVATANSVSEQLSTVATEAIEGVSRSGYDSSQEGGEEEAEHGYSDDTFEDGSVLGGSDEEYRSNSLSSHKVEQECGDSDFEESVAGSSSSKVSDEEEDEDGSSEDGDRTSIDDQHSLKEASHSVVIAQSKKTSSTGVQTDDVAFTATPAGTALPPPPPSLSVLQSLLSMPTISGAGVSLRPPSEAVLDDLLRQHIHLARQSIDCTRAMAGRIEASLNTNHRYTTLQDTQKYLATHKPLPLYSRGS